MCRTVPKVSSLEPS